MGVCMCVRDITAHLAWRQVWEMTTKAGFSITTCRSVYQYLRLSELRDHKSSEIRCISVLAHQLSIQ